MNRHYVRLLFESFVNSQIVIVRCLSFRLRALLIHKDTKLYDLGLDFIDSLRALLIHKGAKPLLVSNLSPNGLRALLIHKDKI